MARSLFPTRRPAVPGHPSPGPMDPPRTLPERPHGDWAGDDIPDDIPDSVVNWGWYVDGTRQDCESLAEATAHALADEGFVWLGLHDPDDEDMAGLARRFNLHPLAIEDAVEGHTRSKLEQFGRTLFLVVSTVAYVPQRQRPETSEIVTTGQIMVFVGTGFVMTVRRGEQTSLKRLRKSLEKHPDRLEHGPASVLYAVLDTVVDSYQQVVNDFEEDVDEVEALVFSEEGSGTVEQVYQIKRELIEFKRAVAPLGVPLHNLATRPYKAIPAEAQAYFREVADHHTEAREAIQSYDEVLSTILAASLNRLSVGQNEDMRKISAFVAIAAVPTLIAGIYGMNFDNMPELHSPYGYFVVWGVILALMATLFVLFRRNNWL